MIRTVKSADDFKALKSIPKVVVSYWSQWHEPSKQMNEGVIKALAVKYDSLITFALVDTDEIQDIHFGFDLKIVPTYSSYTNGRLFQHIEGADPSLLNKLVKALNEIPLSVDIEGDHGVSEMINLRLDNLINSSPVMLFMKGSPETPRCGFSRQIVETLKENKIPFSSFDILADEMVRNALKVYSDWPTYPQLYVSGELVGGLDIVKEMVASGVPLREQLGIDKLQLPPPAPSTEERIRSLIASSPVIAFIKGSPTAPKCGFSRTLVSILQSHGIEFTHFDILTDEEIRAELKIFSDWPTFPQLYVNGSFVGGMDIVKELSENTSAGTLKRQLGIE